MAAVIGVPDPHADGDRQSLHRAPRRGGAFRRNWPREIQEFVKVRLAAHEYPREVEFVAELPMTVTGKVMRRVLRQQAAKELAVSKGKPA